MARICMVTVDHPPDDDRIFHKEAQSLRKAGHEVSILCAAAPGGKVWSMGGKVQLNQKDKLNFSLDKIPVHAVPGPKNISEKFQKKFFRGGFIRRFIQTGKNIKATVYHAHEPVSFYLAYQIAKPTSAKVIFDSHESWVGGTPKEKWIKKYYLKNLRFLITANTISRGHLLSLNPNLHSRVIYNYPQREVFNYPFNSRKFDRIILAHEGILPFNRGLKDMIEALKQVAGKHPRTLLRIIGEVKGEEKVFVDRKIDEYGLQNHIEITGWLPYKEVPRALQDCSIGLILKTPRPVNNLLGGPAIKLFNYFASGMAVIDAGLHESTRILDQTGPGITIYERSPHTIARAVMHLIENLDLLHTYCKRSFEASKNLTWEKESEKLLDFYRTTVLGDQPYKIR